MDAVQRTTLIRKLRNLVSLTEAQRSEIARGWEADVARADRAEARVAELKDAYARSEAGSRAMLAACDLERKRRHAAEADLRTAARELLRAYMRELSEGYFLAGWHIHLDAELRRCVEENDRRLGLGHMTTGEFARLLTLHEQAGGWWRWDEATGCEVFVEDADRAQTTKAEECE